MVSSEGSQTAVFSFIQRRFSGFIGYVTGVTDRDNGPFYIFISAFAWKD
jgi:hypothetical protein